MHQQHSHSQHRNRNQPYPQEGGSELGPPNIGDAYAILSALLFAAQITAAEEQMHALPKKSELPLMAVSMTTVAALTAGAAFITHAQAGDLPAAGERLAALVSDWAAGAGALLGLSSGGAVPPAEAAEAALTAQQLFWTGVVTTDAVLFAELIALQVCEIL